MTIREEDLKKGLIILEKDEVLNDVILIFDIESDMCVIEEHDTGYKRVFSISFICNNFTIVKQKKILYQYIYKNKIAIPHILFNCYTFETWDEFNNGTSLLIKTINHGEVECE